MSVRDIRIEDYNYPLSDSRIARYPLADRASCRLLAADDAGNFRHLHFSDLPALLPEGALLACNDTRVINARIEMHKPTGSRIEIFLLEPVSPVDYVLMFQAKGSCRWSCLVGNRKKWKEGELVKEIEVNGVAVRLSAVIVGRLPGNAFEVEFSWDVPEVNWASVVEAAGQIPIPPYLNRESEKSDEDDYQTVYARMQGSVAAPTAGLHFTDGLIAEIKGRGVTMLPVTLHVGAGTFQPVKADTIGGHPMHTETFTVTEAAVRELVDALEAGRPVAAVGTTTVRTLESLPRLGFNIMSGDESLHVDQWQAYEEPDYDTAEALRALLRYMKESGVGSLTAATSIMIAPGFRWRVVNAMVTNFHQPQSTLLLLVASFLGDDTGDSPLWRRYYDEALDRGYRFLSYGDACFFTHAAR